MATKSSQRPARRERHLTEKAVRDHVGDRSFRRGQNYFRQGAVFDCRRQGNVLKARCAGTSAAYYRVEATVRSGKVAEADCSCPVGEGGNCKHVAAVLLHWLNSPNDFRETEEMSKLLAGRNNDELIALIELMIEREPALEFLVELSFPTASEDGKEPDPKVYRTRAVAAFRAPANDYGGNDDHEWDGDMQIAAELQSIGTIGEQFLKRKDDVSAAAVYVGLLQGFADEYESIDDEAGEVSVVAGECIEKLQKCLPRIEPRHPLRDQALRALFDVVRLDIRIGGIGLSDGALDFLDPKGSPDERAAFATWVREELAAVAQDDSWRRDWRYQTWGGILLGLEADQLDDEGFLERCRELGQTWSLVERLLKLGRIDEAIQEIRRIQGNVIAYADLLVSHKQPERAEALMRERLGGDGWQVRDWLSAFYERQKNWSALLEMRLEEFRNRPDSSRFRAVRKYANKLKRWESLQPEIMELVEKKAALEERIHIALDLKLFDRALELLTSARLRRTGSYYSATPAPVHLAVAQAVEKAHPEAALEIYLQDVELLIAQRGRHNYAEACKQLKKVRELYTRLGREREWKECAKALREENRSLRALHDEMKRAGL